MKTKDIAFKSLEMYEDVFADIFQVLVLKNGLQLSHGELLDKNPASGFDVGKGALREQIRDVIKLWHSSGTPIAVLGIENQSVIDAFMPLRVFAYEGVDYKKQLIQYLDSLKSTDSANSQITPVPVITLIIYTGTRHKWNSPLNLSDLLKIPPSLNRFVSNHKIHVINLAWLSKQTIKKFKSDFKYVADMCRQLRLKKYYRPPRNIKLKHPYDVAMVWYALTGDSRITDFFTLDTKEQEINMCTFLDSIEAKGIKLGKAEGLKLGKAEGLTKGLRLGKTDGVKETALIWNYMKAIGRSGEFGRIYESRRFYLKMLREAQATSVNANQQE